MKKTATALKFGLHRSGHSVVRHVAPAHLADGVAARVRKKYGVEVVERVDVEYIAIDFGGAVYGKGVLTQSFGDTPYAVGVHSSHADIVLSVLAAKEGKRRLYGGVWCKRFSCFLDRFAVIPVVDIPAVIEWLRPYTLDAVSTRAVIQEDIMAGTKNVVFAQRETKGDA